jgi:hypothetical protein
VAWQAKIGGDNAAVGARGWRIRGDLEWGVLENEVRCTICPFNVHMIIKYYIQPPFKLLRKYRRNGT